MKRFIFLYFMFLLLTGCQLTGAQELVDQVDSRFEGVRSISVEGVFCDVSVKPGDASEVHLIGEIRVTRGGDDFSIEVSQNGSELKVWVEHPNNLRGMVKGFLSFQVPDNVLLKVKNVSGNVEVEKIGSDNMELGSVSGNIKVSGAGGNTALHSVSGEVEAFLIDGHLEAKSVSGNVRAANIKGDFSGSSTSGNISARMVEGETLMGSTSGDLMGEDLMKGASLKTTSGNIQVNIMKGNLVCKSVSGDLKLADVTGSLNTSSTSGSQNGSRIMLTGDSRFNAVSGDVKMDLLNELENLSFRLKSGSGRLKAGNSSADDRLEISGGNILVTGSTTSGSQIFE
jgi:DUF4097 and DUF4098 domain-containing protein YvlB